VKIPLTASLVILALATCLSLKARQQLGDARGNQAKLIAEAATLGIPFDPSIPAGKPRIARPPRESRETAARQTAAEFIALAKEMEALQEKGAELDKAAQQRFQERMFEIMDRLKALDAAQLKNLAAEIRNTPELKEESRQGMMMLSIMALVDDHPQSALALFTGISDSIGKNQVSQSRVISTALKNWAKTDPLAALEWVGANEEKVPDLVTEDVKHSILTGAATEDPKRAFQLIGELGFANASDAVAAVTASAKSPAELTAMMPSLRDYLDTLQNEGAKKKTTDAALGAVAHTLANQGYESATQWLAKSDLPPLQLESIAYNLCDAIPLKETGQWIEWVAATLPADRAKFPIRAYVNRWTQNDYQAAGEWLATTPDSPFKNSAISQYAETVSHYAPESAAQWAMTLPPGDGRDTALKQIYQNWPKGDPAAAEAAEAFAKEHGIK
jgi:hypothetical protein